MAATLLLLVALIQQPTDAFTGDWIGKVNDKPVMLLTITNDGTVAGQVVSFFYSNQSGEWKQSDWRRLPMLNPSVVGNTLSFALAPLNTQTGENKPSAMFEFVQTSPTQGTLTGNRGGEHMEIQLKKGNWVRSGGVRK
jgi:hypothetical protein